MIRALWYMMKVALLVVAAVWLADRPGTVDIQWAPYTVHAQMGACLVAVFLVILLCVFIAQIVHSILSLPRAWRRHRQISNREKGHRALALGLTAVAAGDTKNAANHARRAIQLLPGDKGMPLLLQAQVQRLKGNEEEAQRIFAEMLQHKDTAFLGVRGLLQGALDTRNYPKALELAQYGLKLYPKQKWILRVVYDLEIRLRNWDEARKILTRAEKTGAVEPDAARSDRTAMLMAEGEELLQAGLRGPAQQKFLKAHKTDLYFTPAVTALAMVYQQQGQRRHAVKLVEKAWKKSDHANFAELWSTLQDPAKTKDPLVRLKWAEKLLAAKPGSVEAHLIVARAAMEASLWGEARNHLQKAEDISPDARIYKLRAEVERRSLHDDAEALFWLEKADTAPQPRAWVCSETGRLYNEWHAIAEPHGGFNTIIWDFPDVRGATVLPGRAAGDTLLGF